MKIQNIETARLIIRKFKDSDRAEFLSFMLNENSTRFLNFSPEQKTTAGANEVLNWVLSSYDTDNPVCSLAIEHKETGAYVGSVGLSPYGSEGEYECYYSVNEQYLRNGYAKEAMNSLLNHAFNNGAQKVYAFSHIDNHPSEKLAQSLGMKYLGIVERDDLPSKAKCFAKDAN